MNISFIPIRYATALYDFARERGSDKEIYRQAISLSAVFISNKEIKLVLANPVANKKIKQEILFSLLKQKINSDLEKFIVFLFDRQREIFINEILCRYVALFREKNNIHFGKLTTAVAFDSSTEQKIVAAMSIKTGGTLEIVSATDSTLTGGFVLEVDNVRCDASVKGKLGKIKKELMN